MMLGAVHHSYAVQLFSFVLACLPPAGLAGLMLAGALRQERR